MEAAAAFGLAGTVVQFMDFTSKLCHTFLEIWNASKGITQSNEDAQTSAEIFLERLEETEAGLRTYTQEFGGANGGSLVEAVTKRCSDIAMELLSRIEAVQMKGRSGRWGAAIATVKSIWKEKEILKLQDRLRKCRDDLEWAMVVETRLEVSILKSCQEDQFEEFQSAVIAKLTEVIRSEFKELPIFHNSDLSWSPRHLQDANPTGNNSNRHPDSGPPDWDYETAIETPKAMAENIASRLVENDRQILESLDFLVMRDRENAISEAAIATFDWIYRDSTEHGVRWSNFPRWLAEDTSHGIYWINGKAGSGKSTLMKHLFNHRQTRDALKTWAGPSKVLLAGFFFSYSGEELQKSQEGLLRALLYACLKDHRELIPLVVPYHNKFGHDKYRQYWSLDRLKTAFRRLVSRDVAKLMALKFCFFVDGLDEYAGSRSEISSMLIDVASRTHVKVCTSSRPLSTFETSLSMFPNLILQDLTRSDIQQFVTRNLSDNKDIQQLERKEPGLIEDLAAHITSKASGVFLWVTLVVGSLVEGSGLFDEVSDLKRRLRDLPQNLEELYWHMIQRVEPQWYLEEGFRLLLLVQAAGGSVNILTLAFAEMNISLFAKREALSMSPTRADQIMHCERLIGRMKSRCLGLLEATRSEGDIMTAHISFLHKSVSDFLETDNARQAMRQHLSGTHFNPEMQNLLGILWRLKTYRTREWECVNLKREEFFNNICPLVDEFMDMARNAEAVTHSPQTEIVDELNRVTNSLWNLVTFKSRPEQLGLIYWTVAPRNAGELNKARRDSDAPISWICRLSSIRHRPDWDPNSVTEYDPGRHSTVGNCVDTLGFAYFAREHGLHLYASARGLRRRRKTHRSIPRLSANRNAGIEHLRAAEEIDGTGGNGIASVTHIRLPIRRHFL